LSVEDLEAAARVVDEALATGAGRGESVRGLLDRSMARLQVRSLACKGLDLHLSLENGAKMQIAVNVLAPTRDVKTLTMLTRATVERTPLRAPIHAVRIVAFPDRARPAQLDLFRAPAPLRSGSRRRWRISAPSVDRGAWSAHPPNGHRPDEMALAPFEPPGPLARRRSSTGALRGTLPRSLFAPSVPPSCRGLLRERRDRLRSSEGFAGRTVVSSGPWRIETEWWTDAPVDATTTTCS
jgi:hypothetical protein